MSTVKRVKGNYLIQNLENPEGPTNSSRNPELYETTILTSRLTVDGDILIKGDTILEDIIESTVALPVLLINSEHDNNGNLISTKIVPSSTPENPSPPGALVPVAGLEINLGLVDQVSDPQIDPWRTSVQLRYNDSSYVNGSGVSSGRWEASDDGISYYPLSAAAGFSLQDDLDPHLGGNLVVNDFKITSLVGGPGDGLGNLEINSANELILSAPDIKLENSFAIKIQPNNAAFIPGYNVVYAKSINTGGTGVYVTNSQGSDELVSRKKAILFGLIF